MFKVCVMRLCFEECSLAHVMVEADGENKDKRGCYLLTNDSKQNGEKRVMPYKNWESKE